MREWRAVNSDAWILGRGKKAGDNSQSTLTTLEKVHRLDAANAGSRRRISTSVNGAITPRRSMQNRPASFAQTYLHGRVRDPRPAGDFVMPRWLYPFVLAGFVLTDKSAMAQNNVPTPLIPRRVLLGDPGKESPQISPDGRYLSYLAPRDGVMNIWVAPLADLAKARPITADKKRGIYGYFWTYSGRHLIYLQDTNGDECFHIYIVDIITGVAKDATPFPNIRPEVWGLSPNFPNEIVIGLNYRDPRFLDACRLNLETASIDRLYKNDEFRGFVIDEHFKILFATKLAPDGAYLILRPDGNGGWTDFLSIPIGDAASRPLGWNKTGDLFYLVDSRSRDTGALTMLDLKSGKQTVLAQDPRVDCGGVLLHPTEGTVQAAEFTYDRTHRIFFDARVKSDFDILAKLAAGDPYIVSRTLDDQTWIVEYVADDCPVRWYRYDRTLQKGEFLFTSRPALENCLLQKMHSRVVTARDGLKLICYLTLPPGVDPAGAGVPNRPVPMVLLVHGGPWARDHWGYNRTHQLLANRGYAVLSVNFRGSTGFGKKFLNAGNRELGGKMHDDLLDAVNWAVQKKIADPTKVAIFGGSYGGYATLVGLAFTPEMFACGVDIFGPSNLLTMANSPYWAASRQRLNQSVGDPASIEGQLFLTVRSPISQVGKIRRPLLIAHGANDSRVHRAESDQIVEAMRERKIPVTYLLFPDEGHGFVRPANDLAFYAIAEAFLAKHLGGRYEPIDNTFAGSSLMVICGGDGVPGLAENLPMKTSRETRQPGAER
jgi:dipeptidyl aminopeptidase/acylaminoacyl peptidase